MPVKETCYRTASPEPRLMNRLLPARRNTRVKETCVLKASERLFLTLAALAASYP